MVQQAGFPLTARCDLIWPHYAEAKNPSQYIHLNATLVAPLEGEPAGQNWKNTSTKPVALPHNRTVWIPPGEWTNSWTGQTIAGPQTIEVTPRESTGIFQIPMWHKRGGLLVLAHEGTLRIADQDWTKLIVEGFPASVPSSESRQVYEQEFSSHNDDTMTTVELGTSGDGKVWVGLSASEAPRSWVIRLHLRHGQLLHLDDVSEAREVKLRHIHPPAVDCLASEVSYFPFGGEGTAPACAAGPVAEFQVQAPPEGRRIEATIIFE